MPDNNHQNQDWTIVIQPKRGWFDLHLGELWRYRDLVGMFVKRDFVAFYKQTILGPLWYLLQPLFTTLVFTLVFSRVAKIPTDGIPHFLFYLCGTVAWAYFANCLNRTSNTFVTNASIFGKVYFPRLTVPLSAVLVNLVQFAIQLLLFLCFYGFYIAKGSAVKPAWTLLLLPVFVLQMALLGLGVGILVSSLTTKYRDLTFVMSFGVQLWMYATPVVYPLSVVPETWRGFYMLNPMAPIVESLRFSFLGSGLWDATYVIQGWIVTLLILLAGMMLFGRVEKTFMDTV